MLDFYLIVSDYRAAYGKSWLATANRLIPPNVFYFEHDGLVAKYAVLSEADFHRLNGPETRNVSVWARFAQPSRLVWAADVEARSQDRRRDARAAPTLLAAAGRRDGEDRAGLVAPRFRADLFGASFAPSGRTEPARSSTPIVTGTSGSANRPLRPFAALLARPSSWARRRVEGKLLSVVAPCQGQRHLRRRGRLHRLEDQPPRRDRHPDQAVAAASAAARGGQPAAAAPPVRRGSLVGRRVSATATALASAPTVNGFRSNS